jgi:myo-inositol-1(or 4)-monophosphatase
MSYDMNDIEPIPLERQVMHSLKDIALDVGSYLLSAQQKLQDIDVNEKSLNQLVSEVDVSAERQIVAFLKEEYPDAGFITEESTVEQKSADLSFIIDPLDGTTNFLHGLDLFSISIGATFKNELMAGVVYIPSRNELFMAYKGGGAYLNSERIQVSTSQNLKDSLLATGFPYYNFDGMDSYIQSLNYLMQNTRGLRRMGSAAIDLAYTACGRFCGFFELHLHTWDVAAGILLIQEAGGVVSDFKGNVGDISGLEIIASNTGIYKEMRSVLEERFYENEK